MLNATTRHGHVPINHSKSRSIIPKAADAFIAPILFEYSREGFTFETV